MHAFVKRLSFGADLSSWRNKYKVSLNIYSVYGVAKQVECLVATQDVWHSTCPVHVIIFIIAFKHLLSCIIRI